MVPIKISIGASYRLLDQVTKSLTRSESIANRFVTLFFDLNPAGLVKSVSSDSSESSELASLAASSEDAALARVRTFDTPETSLRRSVLLKMRLLSCTRIRVDSIELETESTQGEFLFSHSQACIEHG